MPIYLIVLLSLYGGIGATLSVATAVSNIAEKKPVTIAGMLRVVLLWPLAIVALVVAERRRKA
jgi:hypothetical protein